MLPIIPLLLLLAQAPSEAPDPLAAAKEFVTKVIQTLPAWEADTLAQYEQPELARVRKDLRACLSDLTEDGVLEDTERLKADWKALEALDQLLTKEILI